MGRKVKVVRAMHERVAIVGDVQTEHVLERECLGIGRANHILRAHGDQLMRGGSSPEAFGAAVQQEIDRMFPGISAEGHEQATFAARYGGLG